MRIIIINFKVNKSIQIQMTDFEKYLKNHQQKQKTRKNVYYVGILSLIALLAIVVNSSSLI
jgi:hypothetical protein